ncbi:MAG: hypothetical protein RIQ81_2627 [Pseudomonadota bacterium]|jgi:polar amino acid transport system substrate-binding protein
MRWLVSLAVLAGVVVAPLAFAGDETPIVATELAPYAWSGPDGPKGVMVELVQAMAKKVGHSGKVDLISWNRAQQMTASASGGAPRLILPLIRSPERESRYQWILPLIEDETVFLTMKGKRPAVNSRADLANLRVGVLDGSPLEPWLEREKTGAVDAAPTQAINARKLYAGRIDAWFVVRMVGLYEFKAAGFDVKQLEQGFSLRPIVLYLAASPGFPSTAAKSWRDAFEAIKKDGTYKRILDRYKSL